jgi:hypothetical protein
LASENGNGVVAKLVSLRQGFLASVEEARSQFVVKIKDARESYLNQIVDVTLRDPRLTEVELALGSWSPPSQPVIPTPAAAPPSMVPIGQSGVPEKFPMKRLKGFGVYGRCGNCNAAILEPQAKFCSQCAYPLDEL